MVSQGRSREVSNERREKRTPFSYRKNGELWSVYASNGIGVAMVTTEAHAAFIVRACNRYDTLMQIYNLCRGESESQTMPYLSPAQKALAALFTKFQDEES